MDNVLASDLTALGNALFLTMIKESNPILGGDSVVTDYSSEIAEDGDTVTIKELVIPEVKEFDKTKGIEPDEISSVDRSIKLEKHEYVAFQVDDRNASQMMRSEEALRKGLSGIVNKLGNSVEKSIMKLYPEAGKLVDATTGDLMTHLYASNRYLNEQKSDPNARTLMMSHKLEEKFLLDGIITDSNKEQVLVINGTPTTVSNAEQKRANFKLLTTPDAIDDGSGVYHNLAWDRNGVAIASRALETPIKEAGIYDVVSDPDSGLSIRSGIYYSQAFQKHIYVVDILYGVKALYPEKVVCIKY
jgi:hypothetical protein